MMRGVCGSTTLSENESCRAKILLSVKNKLNALPHKITCLYCKIHGGNKINLGAVPLTPLIETFTIFIFIFYPFIIKGLLYVKR